MRKGLHSDIGQPDEKPASKASRAGTAPLARQELGAKDIERQGHRTGDPPSEPRPAKNARRGSAPCKRPPATREARARGPERERPPGPEGAGGLSAFAAGGKRPQTKRGPSRVPLPQVPLPRLPAPSPAQRAPGAGGALVSHRVAPAVPSALAGLTSGFGMGPGVPRPPWPPAPGGRCGAGCEGRVGARGALGAAQRSRKVSLENGRERRGI